MSMERFLLNQLDQLAPLEKNVKHRAKELKEIYDNFVNLSPQEGHTFRTSKIVPQFNSLFSNLRREDKTLSLFYDNDQESKGLIINYLPTDNNKKELSSIFIFDNYLRNWCKDHLFPGQSFIFQNEIYSRRSFIFIKPKKQDFRRPDYVVNQQNITFQIQLNQGESGDIINLNNDPKNPKETYLTQEKRVELLQISQEIAGKTQNNPWSPIHIRQEAVKTLQ